MIIKYFDEEFLIYNELDLENVFKQLKIFFHTDSILFFI